MQNISYGFRTATARFPTIPIWYFHAEKPSRAAGDTRLEKVCQFYPLALYLNRGFTVDDITTAIQTGWKMAGVTPTPELNYHKETKLLIAFGEPNKLKTIEQCAQSAATVTNRKRIERSMSINISNCKTKLTN